VAFNQTLSRLVKEKNPVLNLSLELPEHSSGQRKSSNPFSDLGIYHALKNNPNASERGHVQINYGRRSTKKIIILASRNQNNSFKISF